MSRTIGGSHQSLATVARSQDSRPTVCLVKDIDGGQGGEMRELSNHLDTSG
ncbi:hypothetical protein TIFTF001_028365 [Ficus carica]|uniref:Uncharacterized protein n=1 Tax=Ficus carica TaxID=3494 RepID=A0AA88DQA1_FICCA|nr:hypothetical protein TIFTF001_028365 [Ficus carica]